MPSPRANSRLAGSRSPIKGSLLRLDGGADRITSPQASHEFAAQAGHSCTLKIWDGFYHEIHNESEQEQEFGYLLRWLQSNLGNE